MRFAILSLVAAGALAVSVGVADAAPPYRGGYNHGFYNGYRGGYNNYSRPYYSGYNSGFGLTVGGARGGIFSFGTGSVYPSYGYNNYYRPYYGGYGYRGSYGYPWRW